MTTRLGATLLVSAFLLVGCAAAPPPPGVPIARAKDIAGKWVGTVTAIPSGATSPSTSIINDNGTWSTSAFNRRFQGAFTVTKGQAHWKSYTTGATGVWILRKVNGQEILDSYGSNSRGEGHRAS